MGLGPAACRARLSIGGARVLLGLLIHLAAFWATSNPDVLAVMDTQATERRRQIIRDAAASLVS